MQTISPYVFPICQPEKLDVTKYPYIRKYIRISADDVIQAIVTEHKVSHDFPVAKGRHRRLVDSRKTLSYILYTYLNWTLMEIGQLLGGRDHTTAIYNREGFRSLYHSDPNYKERADRVFKRLAIDPTKLK